VGSRLRVIKIVQTTVVTLAGMKRFALFLLSGTLAVVPPAIADPIHANGNGDYWHHDSGWIFQQRVGEFVRIGFPQDVAGSRDAVGYYERTLTSIEGYTDAGTVQVVVHGIDFDGNGQYAFNPADQFASRSSSLSAAIPLEATVPVLCGGIAN
jgi:hypothetical protein